MLLFFKLLTKPDRFDCISYEYCNQLFLNFDVQENHFIGNRREEQNTLTMFVKVDLVNVKVTKCVYTYNFRFTSSHCKTISLCSLPPQKNRRFFNAISFNKIRSVISLKLRDRFCFENKPSSAPVSYSWIKFATVCFLMINGPAGYLWMQRWKFSRYSIPNYYFDNEWPLQK